MVNIFFKLILCFVIVKNEGAKILGVFPTPSFSHHLVFRPVMQELARRGHEVVVITPNPAFSKDELHVNIKEIDVHNISYTLWNQLAHVNKGKESDFYQQVTSAFDLVSKVFEAQIKSDDVQKLINNKSEKFDLVFSESCVRPALVLGYLYNAPVIEFSSLGGMFETYDRVGAMSHRLFYPMPLRQRIYNLTMWEKLSELYLHYSIEDTIMKLEESENKMLKEVFGPNTPDLEDLKKNVHMVFLNVRSIWDFNRPVPPNVKYLGGLHQSSEKELPKDLKSYLDTSHDGVIYMSFGTNAQPSQLSPEKIQMFNNVFSRLPYNILWKWDKDTLPGKPKNVKISKWFPQADVLRHPKIKLFITQGGLQSTDEALMAGVPLIVIPMLADQWFNAEQSLKHGIAIQMSIEAMTEETLKAAIETIIGDKSYRENIKKMANIMRDEQQSPVERAVWWTEYVLRHGGAKHLRAAAVDLHWTEYYMLDLVLLVISIFLVILTTFLLLIRKVLKSYTQLKIKAKKN